MLKVPNNLYVKWTEEKGYGVFSDKPILKGQLIEKCYCFPTGTPAAVPTPEMMDYVFNYPKDIDVENGGQHVITLGFGSIYNHADENNAMWYDSKEPKFHFDFIAQRDIEAHEEICTFYGKHYWPQKQTRDEK
jgi:SET domain-containing protein|tara:strand:+ start:118 stop:516 length:399 start_codon:yes stop_codon:yes gene_type:complete